MEKINELFPRGTKDLAYLITTLKTRSNRNPGQYNPWQEEFLDGLKRLMDRHRDELQLSSAQIAALLAMVEGNKAPSGVEIEVGASTMYRLDHTHSTEGLNNDIEWFKEHPRRTIRLRRMFDTEIMDFEPILTQMNVLEIEAPTDVMVRYFDDRPYAPIPVVFKVMCRFPRDYRPPFYPRISEEEDLLVHWQKAIERRPTP